MPPRQRLGHPRSRAQVRWRGSITLHLEVPHPSPLPDHTYIKPFQLGWDVGLSYFAEETEIKMVGEKGREAQEQGNGRFWRVGGLSPGLIWRDFQPSRVLADNTCPAWGQRKVRGLHSGCKSKQGQTCQARGEARV